jgi:hypothetical protein
MQYYLAVFAGTFIYLLLQLNGVYNHPEFVWKTFLKTNWIPTLLNLVIGCVLVAMKEDLANIYPITLVSAMMLGVGGQALIKKLSNVFDSKVDTVVGL